MADLVIDMVDDAIAAYESDDFCLIGDFCPVTIQLMRCDIQSPGGNYLRDGRPKEYLTVHALHQVPGISNAVPIMPARLPRMFIIWRPGKELK